MPFGKIKLFNEKSAFGFIIEEEPGKEMCVHAKALLETLYSRPWNFCPSTKSCSLPSPMALRLTNTNLMCL